MKRGLIVIFLVVSFLVLSLFVYAGPVSDAVVSFIVESNPRIIIHTPENTTYEFFFGDEYVLPLNVSAISFTPDTWWYTLYDLENEEIFNDSVIFVPGPDQEIEGVSGINRLEVFSNDSEGSIYEANVTFTIETQSSPVLGNVSYPIHACENESLNYEFNATDLDSSTLDFHVNPSDPFFIDPDYRSVFVEDNVSLSYLISRRLSKEDTGNHSITISVTDPTDLSDSTETKFEVIPINNHPVVKDLGVNTVYLKGDDHVFYEIVNVSDVEDGTQESENITFSIDFFENDSLFNISSEGVINYTANESDLGSYVIRLCVNDSGISSSHPMILLCEGDSEPVTKCQNFSLTITDENRAPEIIAHYPNNTEEIIVYEGEEIYFNITKYDPDGNIPESYWYLDEGFQQYNGFESNIAEFSYSFGYESEGDHFVEVVVSDGLLNTSMRWNITVLDAEPPQPSSGGGGSVGLSEECIPKWVCGFWNTCQLVDIGFLHKTITKEQSKNLKKKCALQGIKNDSCGFQIRNCYDINECGTEEGKPFIVDVCSFSDDPSCDDGIKNCHQGSCEVLIDCGGPCAPCATCSDGIRNQGEEGVDCGGPCPWKCEVEEPLFKKINIIYILLITLALLIAAVIVRIIKILNEVVKDKIEEKI